MNELEDRLNDMVWDNDIGAALRRNNIRIEINILRHKRIGIYLSKMKDIVNEMIEEDL